VQTSYKSNGADTGLLLLLDELDKKVIGMT